MSLAAIIPHMTSNNAPAPFIASTSNQLAAYAPFNAFQDNTGAWISDVANSHIQIDLGRPYKVGKVFIDTVSSWTGAMMKTLTLQASKDGIDWTDLYVGATTSYKYTEEKDFGVYRHWRVRAGAMTSRGGCVRYFQLYGSPAGFDLDVNNIWVTSVPTTFKGTVYAGDSKTSVRVLINDVVADDWYTFDGIVPVEYEYDPSLFKAGGNIVTVQSKDEAGVTTEEIFLLYKLDFNAYNFNTSSYDFKIKNSPLRPSTDSWVIQQYAMDYLNSETGVSYIFRFKPFAQMDSRVEDRPRLFDRVLKENYNIESNQLLGVRSDNNIAIKQESSQAKVQRMLETIKSGQFKLGFKELGVIQRVFDAWAAINTESVGIKQDVKQLAAKKLKASQELLKTHRLPSRRKDMIRNALTMIQGYELSSRKVFDTVIQYYRAMEDFYPHKETILGGLLINASGEEMIAVKYPLLLSGSKEATDSMVISATPFFDADLKASWIEENKYAVFIPLRDGMINEHLLSSPIPKTNVYVGDNLLTGIKEEMHGTTSYTSFATTEDSQGSFYDVLLGLKGQNKETYHTGVKGAQKDDRTKEVYVTESHLVHKNQKTKEFRIDEVVFVNKFGSDAYIESIREFVELTPVIATEKAMTAFVDKMSADAHVIHSLTNIEKMESDGRLDDIARDFFDKDDADAWNYDQMLNIVDKFGKTSTRNIPDMLVDKLNIDAWVLEDGIYKVNKLDKDMRVDTSVTFIQTSDSKEGRPIFDDMFVEKMGRDIFLMPMKTFVDDILKESYNLNNDLNYVDKLSHVMFNDEMLRTVEKINKQALIVTVLSNVNTLDKASIIHANWEFAIEKIEAARVIDESARFGDKEDKFTHLYEQDLAYIEDKKGFIVEQLLLDHINLNGYIMDLVDAERISNQESVISKETLSDREVALGFIQENIDANRKNEEKEGYIPKDTFVLAGDPSEWEDIWNRYSPGVDILDPPDSDYDYSKLAPAIYDLKTGVPKAPIGPTNKAEVYVQTATSHPIPENNTVGVDDTKRIAVDNYIFIDFVLALESIKNRQKLRYAGMPVAKTIKEVFSQLYTWIQQAAPGHKEYERMFRFARWYAEAVVLRSSKQILHRVYNPWQSSLHTGSGVGIDHMKPGWSYMTGTGTLDTTSLSAHLLFSKENYIDSEFVLRGYFDNPAGQGTMEISIDGVVVDSFVTHGIYERRIEIPQGYHSYDIFFYGTSGTASISSIEIGGTNFVSAHTTSDDSDVNGLKALTELMAQLLGYFELHHGGRKVKGTMEVRQRAVWNTHT